MTPINVVFCGSFLGYSALVLSALLQDPRIRILAVLTTAPHPDKKGQLIHTPVHQVAQHANLPIFTPDRLSDQLLSELQTQVGVPDIVVTVGYGKLLPPSWLDWPKQAAVNVHFSLLPKYRGANPAEWALLLDEKETGITLITMSPEFDTGEILVSSRYAITSDDTRESIYQKIYELAATKTGDWLVAFIAGELRSQAQTASPTPYATRLQRPDGFIPWAALQAVMHGQTAEMSAFSPILQKVLVFGQMSPDAVFVGRAVRALSGFPSLWTLIPTAKGDKRMKILDARVVQGKYLELDRVQIEGKPPARWAEVKNNVRQ